MFQPDEQPGALPEVLPSPDQNANIDRCWTCRSMVMQAWGHYGTAWPVIHQQLGVARRWARAGSTSCRRCRTGSRAWPGATSGSATGRSTSAEPGATTVTVRTRLRELNIGLTLKAKPRKVTLDGRTVRKPDVRVTNRGVEVTVKAPPNGRHTVRARGLSTAPVWNATSTSFARLALWGRSSTPSRS